MCHTSRRCGHPSTWLCLYSNSLSNNQCSSRWVSYLRKRTYMSTKKKNTKKKGFCRTSSQVILSIPAWTFGITGVVIIQTFDAEADISCQLINKVAWVQIFKIGEIQLPYSSSSFLSIHFNTSLSLRSAVQVGLRHLTSVSPLLICFLMSWRRCSGQRFSTWGHDNFGAS